MLIARGPLRVIRVPFRQSLPHVRYAPETYHGSGHQDCGEGPIRDIMLCAGVTGAPCTIPISVGTSPRAAGGLSWHGLGRWLGMRDRRQTLEAHSIFVPAVHIVTDD